ncbi:hypothetical protein [Microbacterium aurantiacum]|uniref:hypothetical protein n=1 Tax=Microbacterium aurantiacum TaxID=162393 RepID=UPI00343A177B
MRAEVVDRAGEAVDGGRGVADPEDGGLAGVDRGARRHGEADVGTAVVGVAEDVREAHAFGIQVDRPRGGVVHLEELVVVVADVVADDLGDEEVGKGGRFGRGRACRDGEPDEAEHEGRGESDGQDRAGGAGTQA